MPSDDDGPPTTPRPPATTSTTAAATSDAGAPGAGSIALQALSLSRAGDVAGAVALLREARSNGPLDEPATSLLFNLLQDAPDDEGHGERLALCEHGLSMAKRPVTRSSWHLRRGTLHVERHDRAAALSDLQMVLKLKASDDHTAQARKALLVVATMPGPTTKKRP